MGDADLFNLAFTLLLLLPLLLLLLLLEESLVSQQVLLRRPQKDTPDSPLFRRLLPAHAPWTRHFAPPGQISKNFKTVSSYGIDCMINIQNIHYVYIMYRLYYVLYTQLGTKVTHNCTP